MTTIAEAVVTGMLVMLAGTLPRNVAFAANLKIVPGVPWAVPVMGAYLWIFWRYLGGAGATDPAALDRRARLRSNPVSGRAWAWALAAGVLGILALVLGLRVANRIVTLPHQELPDLAGIPRLTVIALLLAAAPIAGIVEEAAFRGYMQTPIARDHGFAVAILVTGTLFAVAHLDFTPVLWPYYVAVSAIYGGVTHLTKSIRPAVVLHTSGNLFSNFDLWLHGQAEWQTGSGSAPLVWATGADRSFWLALGAFVVATAAAAAVYRGLAGVTRPARTPATPATSA